MRTQDAIALDLRVAVLPEGRDPDDVIRADPEQWRALIAGARPVLDYRLEASAASHDLTGPRGRSQLAQEFLPLLSAVADPVVRAHYLQRLSRLTQTAEEQLIGMLAQARGRPAALRQAVAAAATNTHKDHREEYLLALLLRHPGLRPAGMGIPQELLWETENQQLLNVWKDNEDLEAAKEAVPPELQDYLERLLSRRLPDFDLKQAREALLDCMRTLDRRQLEAEKQAASSLVVAGEEELGASVVAAALAAAPDGGGDERLLEFQRLHEHDTEIGRRLPKRERSDPSERSETRIDG